MTTATAFKVNVLQVSTGSPELAPLAGREYKSEYTSLPNANLPRLLRQGLDKVFFALTGEELPLEENTFLIKARDGVYTRLFGPILKAGSDEVDGTEAGKFYIQWGNRYIPVSLDKEGLTTASGTVLETEFASFNFSGRGEDHALMLAVDDEDGTGQTVLPVSVRFIDYQNPTDLKTLNTLVKKGKSDQIIPLIEQIQPRGSGSLKRADHDVEFRDLEPDVPYQVISYRSVKTAYGMSYRIVLNNLPDEGQTSETWAHSSLRSLLATQPEISVEKPAILMIKDKQGPDKDGKVRMRCSLILSQQKEVSEDDLNLNF
jgi:hypothetical protein